MQLGEEHFGLIMYACERATQDTGRFIGDILQRLILIDNGAGQSEDWRIKTVTKHFINLLVLILDRLKACNFLNPRKIAIQHRFCYGQIGPNTGDISLIQQDRRCRQLNQTQTQMQTSISTLIGTHAHASGDKIIVKLLA